MLEFLYATFLVRLGGNFFRNATRSPQDASKVFRMIGGILMGLCAIWLYKIIFEKNPSQKDFEAVYTTMPILLVVACAVFYASSILQGVSSERYEKIDLQFFKNTLNGFIGVALFFYVFVFINAIFGFIFIILAMVWLIVWLLSFGLMASKTSFEDFVGFPYYFFVWENNFFKFFGTDTLSFGVIILLVVVFLPFLLSLYVILYQKSLLEK